MTIKEIIFKRPLINPSVQQISAEMERTKPKELSVGTHDITPPGFRDKYEVKVEDPGNEDNIGKVTVTRRGGKAISTVYIDGDLSQLDSDYKDKKTLDLGPGSPPMVLARPIVLDDPSRSGVKVHGVIYYDPKKK